MYRVLLLLAALSLKCEVVTSSRVRSLLRTEESPGKGYVGGENPKDEIWKLEKEEVWEKCRELDSGNGVKILGKGESNKSTIICPEKGSAIIIKIPGVVIRNVIFANCTASAVIVEGPSEGKQGLHVEFENVDFVGNDGSFQTRGGGISMLGRSSANVTNCRFLGNTAGVGGAIFVDVKSKLAVRDSTFMENTATNAGGAIFGLGKVTVEGSEFQGCSCSDVSVGREPITKLGRPLEEFIWFPFPFPGFGGGAIVLANAQKAIISSSRFINNTAAAGGAISAQYEALANPMKKIFRVVDCQFEENVAAFSGNYAFVSENAFQGGAIYLLAGNSRLQPSIESSTFRRNEAHFGGALHIVSSDSVPVDIVDSSFTSNSAKQGGGGVVLRNTGSVNWSNNLVIGNRARVGGGILLTNNAFLTIVGVPRGSDGTPLSDKVSKFEENLAVDGAAIACVFCGATVMQDPVFTNNTALRKGGALSVQDSLSEVFLQQVVASGNKAFIGGAVHVDSAADFKISAVRQANSTLEKNQAASGGALHITMENRRLNFLQLSDILIEGNQALSAEAMIEILSTVESIDTLGDGVDLQSQDFGPCKAGRGGGLCLVMDSPPSSSIADVQISDVEFTSNCADDMAGGMFISVSKDDDWGFESCAKSPEFGGSSSCRGNRILRASFKDNSSKRMPALSVSNADAIFVACQKYESPDSLENVLKQPSSSGKCITIQENPSEQCG